MHTNTKPYYSNWAGPLVAYNRWLLHTIRVDDKPLRKTWPAKSNLGGNMSLV